MTDDFRQETSDYIDALIARCRTRRGVDVTYDNMAGSQANIEAVGRL